VEWSGLKDAMNATVF